MRKEIKEKWLEALRSGKYEKTKGNLCEVDTFTDKKSYCCLGVLCDLHRKITKKGDHTWTPMVGSQHYMGHSGFLPMKVMKWAGIKKDDGQFAHKKEDGTEDINSLTSINDRTDTFEKVIDAIEKHF